MKAYKIKTLIGALALSLCIPIVPAQAYEVKDVQATRLTSEYSLFTITYEFGFLNREVLIPLDAMRGGSRRDKSVGFALMGENGTTSLHTALGVVLSDVELRGRDYYLPKGKNGDFTLVAIVKTADVSALGLAITRLPFVLIDGQVSVGASIAADNLGPYKTPLLPALTASSPAPYTPVGK
ncbi:hypothetical protein K2Q16_02910 [Patescibacteria group bacterium]|nr:hypothetical protein [Patescibacteria group bacterium]